MNEGGGHAHHPSLRNSTMSFRRKGRLALEIRYFLGDPGHSGSSINQGQKLLGLASAAFAGFRTVIFFIE